MEIKKPQIYLNSTKVRVVPQCIDCGLILDNGEPTNSGWEYIEINPYGDCGWLCPKCQRDKGIGGIDDN